VRSFLYLFIAFIQIALVSGQQIILDESYEDWENGATTYIDKKNDGVSNGIDITDVKISNDDINLYIYFDINKEINIQANNNLTIFIDIDNNVSTGLSKNGIGVDLTYSFGFRSGKLYLSNASIDVFHDQVGLVTSPTVTSSKFEMSILRSFNYGNPPLKVSNTIKLFISDESNAGDKAPDAGAYSFNFDNSKTFEPIPISFSKLDANDIRIVSYNVLQDNLFDPALRSNFERIFKAIRPDIIGMCEIYSNSGAQAAALMESFLPSAANQKWYYGEAVPDIRMVSRYPITNTRNIDGNGAFQINVGGKQVLVIVAHLPCCDDETGRQAEVDKIMSFVRSVKYGISTFQLPVNSPIIIVGDMNLVGLKQQQQTFIDGNIINNSNFGPDFTPDWDNTFLEDAKPLTSYLPFTFTWYNDYGRYSAGRLDYVFYTGSVMKLKNSFSLWSPVLPNDMLTSTGLQRLDVPKASDHIPVIVDFDWSGKTDLTEDTLAQFPFRFKQNNEQIIFESNETGIISVYNTAGSLIYKVEKSTIGDFYLDIDRLTGLFIFSFETKQGIFSSKFYR
jgi:exonuclease III